MGWSLRHRNLTVVVMAAAGAFAVSATAETAISASVDKRTVELGDFVTLTITLSGDLSDIKQGPSVEGIDGFQIAASRQATNLAIRGDVVERSVTLVYVLVPTKPGTFRLGPFSVNRNGQSLTSAPVEVTVKKPVLPPSLHASRRYFL